MSSAAGSSGGGSPKSIYLVSYPKVVYLYPSLIVSLVAGTFMAFAGNEPSTAANVMSLVFLCVLGLNLVVMGFDFPRTTSLTLLFFFVALGIGLWSLFQFHPEVLGFASEWLSRLDPFANASFFFLYATFLGAIFAGVFVSRRFDYWEVRPNELLHHHGFLSDLERFSAPQLRISKEINDLFEYVLLGAGRLILHPSEEKRSIVLENVFFITRKEAAITKMLGALQVEVRSSSDAG